MLMRTHACGSLWWYRCAGRGRADVYICARVGRGVQLCGVQAVCLFHVFLTNEDKRSFAAANQNAEV